GPIPPRFSSRHPRHARSSLRRPPRSRSSRSRPNARPDRLTPPAAARDGRTMKVALIAGAGGAASKRLIETLLADPDWSVIGLARTPRESTERLGWIAADLFDRDGCRRALADQAAVTHIFYTARAKHGETGVESVPDNIAMLRNLIDAVEPAAAALAHIHLVQGTKYYGMHLGPFRTPAREDDPRPDFPNFYYDQQDLLAECAQGKAWAWSASRPTFIYD